MPALEPKTKPRWERRKDARPQELLAAALDLFVERGYAAARLDDVAARCLVLLLAVRVGRVWVGLGVGQGLRFLV
jgi:AcrR family transcriptional regulator